MYTSKSSKNSWLLFLFILCGIVIGGFIGDNLSSSTQLAWLSYGKTFGIVQPLIIDLNVIVLTFALSLTINIAGIIGIIISIFIYKKIIK